MYNGLLHLHNLLRWVILILLLIGIIRHLMGMTGNKSYTSGDRKTGLFLMIAAHTTLLVGIYQWFAGPVGFQQIQDLGMGAVMKDSAARFWAIEHLLGMLIGIVLITIGKGVGKKNLSDRAKHRKTFWYYFFALIVILASVPWPFRDLVARPWFPGAGI
jgi:hypothetical protein